MSPVTGISSWYFSWTSGDPHRSGFKLHIVVLSILCVMFQVIIIIIIIIIIKMMIMNRWWLWLWWWECRITKCTGNAVDASTYQQHDKQYQSSVPIRLDSRPAPCSTLAVLFCPATDCCALSAIAVANAMNRWYTLLRTFLGNASK